MPQQNRDAIQELALKIARHIDAMPSDNPQGPTPEEKDTLKGAVMVVANLAFSFDRIADACERIAQALEDEHKIHTPQPASDQASCQICGEVPSPTCTNAQCFHPCPVCDEIGHQQDCGKVNCPKFLF